MHMDNMILVQYLLLCSLYVTLKHYNAAGEHMQRVVLPYLARWRNAICCTKEYIYVASWKPAAIHIHTWSGLLLQTLSHQELNIDEGARIHAVNCDVAGNTLMLTAGQKYRTKTLHAYRVSDK